MATLPCSYCHQDFDEPKRRGRPSSFCSDTCRTAAAQDPHRRCRNCGERYLKNPDNQFFCSEDCRTATKATCRQCGAGLADDGVFCSSACVAAHAPNATCGTCNGPIPAPTKPPFMRMPRFCSDECRSVRAVTKGGSVATVHSQTYELYQALYVDMQPTKLFLPTAGEFLPFRIPAALAPPIVDRCIVVDLGTEQYTAKLSSKVVDSIEFWNRSLKKFNSLSDPTTALAELGRTGIRPDQPEGIRPLVECWPWVGGQFDRRNVLDQWLGARHALPYTRKQINNERAFLQSLIDDYRVYLGVQDGPRVELKTQGDANAEWKAKQRRQKARAARYFRKQESGHIRLIDEINHYYSMLQPPNPRRYLGPTQVKFLNSDEFWDFQQSLGNLLTGANRRRWQVGDYTTDPTPLKDRLAEEIQKILELERANG